MKFSISLLLTVLATSFGLSASEPARYMVYRSEDRGRSWFRSDTGLPSDSRINVFTFTADSIIAGTDSGIFISSDSGKAWRKSTIAARAVRGTPISADRVTSIASVNGHLFAGTSDNAMLSSSDSGKTWQRNRTFPDQIVRSLFATDVALYAGTDAAGVSRTTDFGQTWIQLAAGLPERAQVLTLASINDRLFAGLYANGLYTWNDSEQIWVPLGAAAQIKPLVLVSIGETLIAGHNPGGIHISDDLGRSWNPWKGENNSPAPVLVTSVLPIAQSTISLNAPIWDLAANNDIAFAGAADGIFYSEDRGRHWTRFTHGLPPVCPGVAFLVRSNLVLAATLTNHKTRSP